MIYDIPRTATVISSGYCTLAELSVDNFQIIAEKVPSF